MGLKPLLTLVTVIALTFPGVLAAEESTSVSSSSPTPKTSAKAAKIETKASAKAEKSKAKLNERAAKEIERRIEALNKLITRLGKMKRLSAESQASLKTKVEAEIAKLTALKTKIAADTDAATLKADVESIKSSYRIFALFMPQINIMATSDSILTAAENLSKLAAKLQTRLDLETDNPDLSSLKTSLAEMNNSLTAANTQATSAQTTVIVLTPEGYPDNLATLKSAREQVKTAHESLKTARKAAESIIKSIKKKTPTPSATP